MLIMLVLRTVRLDCVASSSRVLSTSSMRNKSSDSRQLNVDFYFDTVSPYTWPAWEVMIRYRNIWNLNINYKPVFLGGLTSAASMRMFEGRTPL